MAKGKFIKIAATIALSAVCAIGVTACGGSSSNGVAASVNGTNISEEYITNYIESMRLNMGYTDDTTWTLYLQMIGRTPESLRLEIIDYLVKQELINQYASEKGVEVSAEEVDKYVDVMKERFGSDAEWAAALSSAGMTEEDYRTEIEESLRKQALTKVFEGEVQVPEEDLLTMAQLYAEYLNGARRSSHILFSLDDQETAQSVLNRIKSGELDFEEAAKEYSIDGSAENGGDVGWDAASTFVTEYQEALSALEEGEISDLVESQFGYHIIKCTEHFVAPEKVTSIDQVPEDFRETIVSAASSSAVETALNAWLDEVREKANIVINDIPKNAPYNVAMSTAEGEDAEASESASAESDSAESASAEAASASAESASASSSSSN